MVFKKANRAQTAPVAEPEQAEDGGTGKGRPTPSRKQQEAANRRPLVPNDRKEAAKRARSQSAAARERTRVGIAAGDDRYLTKRDKGPQRRFVRDYVDARFNIGEYLMPVLVIMIIVTLLPERSLQDWGMIGLWIFFLITVADALLLGARITKRLGDKYGRGKVERGLKWYAAMRAVQLRFIRLPKPQVRRREFPS